MDKVRTDKYGVYGELLIQTTAPGHYPHIHGPVQTNLTGSNARRDLARHLAERVGLDWATILEQAFHKVVEAHRQGFPTIHMADFEMPPPMTMRVAPLLQEGAPTILFGDGDSLKSYFATYMAVLTALGRAESGLTPVPGNVLYLDYEEEEGTFYERLDLITAALGVAVPEGIYWRKMVEPLMAEFPAVNQQVMECNIKLVVVDSAATAALEPEKAESAIAYFKALRSLNTTTATIAHDTKATKGLGQYPFGSVFWRNLARSLFYVKADRNQEDVAISLKHTKANNGRRLNPMGFKFHFNEDGVFISNVSASEYQDLAKDIPVHARLMEALTEPQSVNQLAELLDLTTDTVGKALRRGKGTQFVQNGTLWGKIYRE